METCPFPIWSIFITTDITSPSTIRPGTYREPFWKGRAIVCINDTETDKNLQPETEEDPETWETVVTNRRIKGPWWTFWAKAYSKELTIVNSSIGTWDSWSAKVVTNITPNDDWKITISHYNYQPSIAAYIWKRVDTTDNFNPFNIDGAFTPTGEVFPKNVIIDPQTMWPKSPDPYNP